MPPSTVRAFTDPDAYHAAIRHARVQGIVTGAGDFRAELTAIGLKRITLQSSEQNLARVSFSAIDPEIAGMFFLTDAGPPASINGLEASLGDIIVFSRGPSGYNQSPAGCRWGALALPHVVLAAAGRALVGRELTAPPRTYRITPPALSMARLLNLHRGVGRLDKTAPGVLAAAEVARALEQALVEAAVACLAGGKYDRRRTIPDRRLRVMRRLEEALQRSDGCPLYVRDLCAATGVSYPTLRACCQEHLGMSPKRYLLLRRMHLVRRALQGAYPRQTTVTRMATAHGFWELGRFSAAYRALFGETPAATLRRPPIEIRMAETADWRWGSIESANLR